MREEFGGSAGLSVLSLNGLYLGGSKFYLSLLLRLLWESIFDSTKHLVHIVL